MILDIILLIIGFQVVWGVIFIGLMYSAAKRGTL